MFHYILQVVSFQLLFLVIYDIFHRRDTFFNWNRLYLVLAPLISLLLPFIKIEFLGDVSTKVYTTSIERIITFTSSTDNVTAINLSPEKTASDLNWWIIIYLFGIGVSLLLFILKIHKLQILRNVSLKSLQSCKKVVTLPNSKQAFSFWNTIFLGDALSEEEKQHILQHELVHVREKHSLDQLFFELLKILLWWNPIIYLFQQRITVLHEYIADELVVSDIGKMKYLEQLLNATFQTQEITFVNQFFNQSLIKKRILMLQKSKSKTFAKFKYLLLLPVILGILSYTSCNREVPESITNDESVTKKSEVIAPRENEPVCLNKNSKYDTTLDNYLKIINGNNSEVFVSLVSLDKDSTKVRTIHLNKGVTHFIRNIPEGNYRTDIVYGTGYIEKNVNGKCIGSFDKVLITESGHDILDFNTVRTEKGLNLPNYVLALDLSDEDTEEKEIKNKYAEAKVKSECLKGYDVFNKKIDNYFGLKNSEDSEIIVFLTNRKTNQIVRAMYLNKGEQRKMRNIPEDIYYVKVIHGEGYIEKTINGKCAPSFKTIFKEEDGMDELDFTTIKTKNGFNMPNFSMTFNLEE